MSSLLKEGTKIGVVGKSGSGKSVTVDVLAFALMCQKEGSGDYMRELAAARNVDLETFTHMMTPDDDKLVDQRASALLEDCCWTGILHGRLIRLLAEGLIKEGKLARDNYLNIAVECSSLVRAARGLDKFRKKPGHENAVVLDVLRAQAKRDNVDWVRIKPQFEKTHDLRRQG